MRLAVLLLLAMGFVAGCDKPRFQPVSVLVVDEATLQPVANATIRTVCMGLSPHLTNKYVTDNNGRAQVMKYEKGASAVSVLAAGYSSGGGVTLTNAMTISLRKTN